MNNKKCAIIISSFDGYSDAWYPFFTLFFRYWPDCPFDIYLIGNYLAYQDERVKTINIKPDKGWSSNLKFALNKIDKEYILYMQEDYFLMNIVETEKIENALKFIKKENAVYLRLNSGADEDYNGDIGKVAQRAAYKNSTQAAIWKKSFLYDLLRDGENGWDFETKDGIQRAWKSKELFLASKIKRIDYFATAIVKGRFLSSAIELCRKENIEIVSNRKIETKLHYKLRHNRIAKIIYTFFK